MKIYLGGPPDTEWRYVIRKMVAKHEYDEPGERDDIIRLRQGMADPDYLIFRFTKNVTEGTVRWASLAATMACLRPGKVLLSIGQGVVQPLNSDLSDLAALISDSGGMWMPGDMDTMIEVLDKELFPYVSRAEMSDPDQGGKPKNRRENENSSRDPCTEALS